MKKDNIKNIFAGLKIQKKTLSDQEKQEMLAVFISNIAQEDASHNKRIINSFLSPVKMLIAASFIGIICFITWKYLPNKHIKYIDYHNFTLSDKTNIILQKGATLSYNPLMFLFDRKVRLTGEAYFDVKTKGSFSVITEQGQVNVLGTEFGVSTTPVFSTQCFRGLVEVWSNKTGRSVILHPAEQANLVNGAFKKSRIIESSPYWINNKFKFDHKPLTDVISILAQHYNLSVIGMKNTEGLDFTGSFPADNLEIACQLVFGPYELQYKIDKQYLVISTSN